MAAIPIMTCLVCPASAIALALAADQAYTEVEPGTIWGECAACRSGYFQHPDGTQSCRLYNWCFCNGCGATMWTQHVDRCIFCSECVAD